MIIMASGLWIQWILNLQQVATFAATKTKKRMESMKYCLLQKYKHNGNGLVIHRGLTIILCSQGLSEKYINY